MFFFNVFGFDIRIMLISYVSLEVLMSLQYFGRVSLKLILCL